MEVYTLNKRAINHLNMIMTYIHEVRGDLVQRGVDKYEWQLHKVQATRSMLERDFSSLFFGIMYKTNLER